MKAAGGAKKGDQTSETLEQTFNLFLLSLFFPGESEAAVHLARRRRLLRAAASPPAAEAAKPAAATAAAAASRGASQDRVQRPLLPKDFQLRLHEEEEQEGGAAATGAAAEAQSSATAAATAATTAIQLRQQWHLRIDAKIMLTRNSAEKKT